MDNDTILYVGDNAYCGPLNGVKTLFVVGIINTESILLKAKTNYCSAIYIGARQSFTFNDYEIYAEWEKMINVLLEHNIRVSFEFAVTDWPLICDSGMFESPFFFPVINVPLPYCNSSLNSHNTTIKIGEPNVDASTNDCVWCHSLYSLTGLDNMTRIDDYNNDIEV